jgi:hypothetical protein
VRAATHAPTTMDPRSAWTGDAGRGAFVGTEAVTRRQSARMRGNGRPPTRTTNESGPSTSFPSARSSRSSARRPPSPGGRALARARGSPAFDEALESSAWSARSRGPPRSSTRKRSPSRRWRASRARIEGARAPIGRLRARKGPWSRRIGARCARRRAWSHAKRPSRAPRRGAAPTSEAGGVAESTHYPPNPARSLPSRGPCGSETGTVTLAKTPSRRP